MLDFLQLLIPKCHGRHGWQNAELVIVAGGLYYCNNMDGIVGGKNRKWVRRERENPYAYKLYSGK